MPNLLLVMIGGAAGAGLRYEAGRIALSRFGGAFPSGTLFVNLLGSLAIGLLAGLLLAQGAADRPLWLFLATGLLGGFTTFSAFSLELVQLVERGQPLAAAGYAAFSVVAGLALAALGFAGGRAVA
ncbi:MAG TPA: fluoride efflux transporter CrcB [Allosphingosinicella sp.]|jgi:CrcB protein